MNTENIPQPVMVGDPPGADTITFGGVIGGVKANGERVNVDFSFTYPSGEGMALLKLVEVFPMAAAGALAEHLLEVGDASVAAARGLSTAAAAVADEDVEDHFDDLYEDEDGV